MTNTNEKITLNCEVNGEFTYMLFYESESKPTSLQVSQHGLSQMTLSLDSVLDLRDYLDSFIKESRNINTESQDN